MSDAIYHLPGRGGEITTGLGQGLLDRGCSIVGRETRGAFLKLTFQQQLDAICNDLQDDFWSADARLRIAANMFGLACGYVAVCLLAPLWLACGPDGAFLVGSPNTVRDKLHYVERPRNLGRPSSKISQGTRSAQCTCAVG